MAYPSTLVTVTQTSVRGLAIAAAASFLASAGSIKPKPWISPGRSARPSSVVRDTTRSGGRSTSARPAGGVPDPADGVPGPSPGPPTAGPPALDPPDSGPS